MKHMNILTTGALIALLGASSVASAGVSTQSNWVMVNVTGGCDLEPMADKVINAVAYASTTNGLVNFAPRVRCNDQLAYTIEVGTDAPSGSLIVTDGDGDQELVEFRQPGGLLPWGTVDFGEELAAVGNGAWQQHNGQILFNIGSTWKPKASTYERDTYLQLNF
jgi:hypothetical protein